MVDLSDVHYGKGDERILITGNPVGDISEFRKIDLVIDELNIIIEFQGNHWHPIVSEEDILDFISGYPVKNIGIFNEIIRDYSLKNLGYSILYVWESDYLRDPRKEVERAIDFIRGYVNNFK